jgi:hypothetical protein
MTERREVGEGMTEAEALAAGRTDLLVDRPDTAIDRYYAELGRQKAEFEAREARPRVVFIDIDGVLLTRARWLHPANTAARALLAEKSETARRRALETVSYDPNAVQLVNRLARTTRAKLVVSSFWRRSFGVEETHRKLLAEGIEPDLFHDDHSCDAGYSRDPTKQRDIWDWLDRHRTNSLPRHPGGVATTEEERRSTEEALRVWHAAYERVGLEWIVIDDEPGPDHLVRTHPELGFTAEDYRVAVRALGGEDAEFGVRPVPDGLWEEVLAIHACDPIAAARWVEGVRAPETFRPVRLLDWREDQALDFLMGRRDASDEEAQVEALAAFRRRLATDRAPRPEQGVGGPLDADF